MRLLLFSPGRLTKEFLDGRRVRYISPIRLYLIWSIAFFSLLSITPARRTPKPLAQATVVGRPTPTGNEVVKRLRVGAINVQKDSSAVIAKLTKWWPSVMFALVPVFGALMWLTYRKAVRFYLPHLYFAIHVHAFIFFLLSAAQLIRIPLVLAGTASSIVFALLDLGLLAVLIPYVVVALHGVYGGSGASASLRGIAAVVGYTALVFVAVVALGIAAAMTML